MKERLKILFYAILLLLNSILVNVFLLFMFPFYVMYAFVSSKAHFNKKIEEYIDDMAKLDSFHEKINN